jgi:hypothetical protein
MLSRPFPADFVITWFYEAQGDIVKAVSLELAPQTDPIHLACIELLFSPACVGEAANKSTITTGPAPERTITSRQARKIGYATRKNPVPSIPIQMHYYNFPCDA